MVGVLVAVGSLWSEISLGKVTIIVKMGIHLCTNMGKH
jgi:hypothetical protein